MRRGSIAMRLLAAFLVVSLLPIGVLALLSYQESRGATDAHVEERPGEAGRLADTPEPPHQMRCS
jgi:hypothetical protein